MIDRRQDHPGGTGKAPPRCPGGGSSLGGTEPAAPWDSLSQGSWWVCCYCCSLAQSRPTLCDPVDCSTPGLSSTIMVKLMSIESVMPSNHLILTHSQLVSGEGQRLPGAGHTHPL